MKSKHLNCNINENDLKFISKNTEGWCGADLENLLN
jgi:ATP-dependent Zn protease